MRFNLYQAQLPKQSKWGFTLAEVVIAIAIIAIVFGGMVVAYIQATRRAQWSGYSLAARALSVQQIEQARSADWDPTIPRNEITNLNLSSPSLTNTGSLYIFTGYTTTNLDLPTSGTNFVQAVNYVTVKLLYVNNTNSPPVKIQLVRVDTVWPFLWGGKTTNFTNTICTYEAPDNRDNSTF